MKARDGLCWILGMELARLISCRQPSPYQIVAQRVLGFGGDGENQFSLGEVQNFARVSPGNGEVAGFSLSHQRPDDDWEGSNFDSLERHSDIRFVGKDFARARPRSRTREAQPSSGTVSELSNLRVNAPLLNASCVISCTRD